MSGVLRSRICGLCIKERFVPEFLPEQVANGARLHCWRTALCGPRVSKDAQGLNGTTKPRAPRGRWQRLVPIDAAVRGVAGV